MFNDFIHRELMGTILESSQKYHIITILGPRQSGKTTLSRKLFDKLPYINLERPSTFEFVSSDPLGFIKSNPEGAVIDEVQNMPSILSYLQAEVDEDVFAGKHNRLFVLTGSSNLSLMEKITQTLAGRTAIFTLLPLSLHELGSDRKNLNTDTLILNGGYPAVWLDPSVRTSLIENYYHTYIERDVRQIVNIKDLRQFQIFMGLCAGRIGSEFNPSTMSTEIGVSVSTINTWLNVLSASYILYLLPPFYENIGKRLVKKSKIYFYDTAVASHVLNIRDENQLKFHPLRGRLFENMVMNEFVKADYNRGRTPVMFFYRDQHQHEVDLLRTKGDKIDAYEIKSAMTYNSSFSKQLEYLQKLLQKKINTRTVIYDGNEHSNSVTTGLINFRDIDI